jgi:hypothetical protein
MAGAIEKENQATEAKFALDVASEAALTLGHSVRLKQGGLK